MENLFDVNGSTIANKRTPEVAVSLGDSVLVMLNKADGTSQVLAEESIDVDSAVVAVTVMARKL